MYSVRTIVLAILICMICLYLMYRLFQKKRVFDEGFESMPYPERDAFLQTNNLPLKEYAINASFNSAYDGGKISIEQLGKVMYAGCRFIDVNLFITDTSDVYVGFAVDNAPTLIDVSLPFHSVIEYINSFGFMVDPDTKKKVGTDMTDMIAEAIQKTNVKGKTIQDVYPDYPLFLNIRVYRPPKSNIDIVGQIAKEVKGLKRAYVDGDGKAIKITQYTRLGDLMGKVIVTMDIENILQIYASPAPYDPNNIPIETRNAIEEMVNIKTGGDMWSTFYKYTDVEKNTHTPLKLMDTNITDNTYETNTLNMKLSYPYYTGDKSNPDSYSFLLNHQIQTVPHRFYIRDENLAKYIDLFKTNKTPFLPLYHAYTYINKKANPLV